MMENHAQLVVDFSSDCLRIKSFFGYILFFVICFYFDYVCFVFVLVTLSCGHLLGKGLLLGSPLHDLSLRFSHFPI